jgi:serine phosphatase RsbU (regulator of sigma subunit)
MLHRDGMYDVVERFVEIQLKMITESAPQMRILAGGPPILSAHAATKNARAYVHDTELLDLCDELGICSAMYVPLIARDRVLGCLTLVSGRSGRIYDEEDLAFAIDLARRAALVVDNTTLYEREHRIAHQLQASLLPTLPVVDGLDIAARYVPCDRSAEVGGDFYDVMELPGGLVGLAVGDVVGHDLHAAAVMGQLRILLRAAAWESVERDDPPAAAVTALDHTVQSLELTTFATLFFAQAHRGAQGTPWSVKYVSAGSPPPFLLLPDGAIVELDRARGIALGVSEDAGSKSVSVEIPSGGVLVAFTDGLVERRHTPSDVVLEELRSAIDRAPRDRGAGAIADAVLAAADGERADDIALLVVGFS